MKVQHINNLANQPNPTKNTKAPDKSFEHVLKNHVKNDNHDEKNTALSNPRPSTEQIDSTRRLAISNMRQFTITGLKELVKDSISDTGAQILNEIESICDDETGESIDMKLLDELLELCMENKDNV